MMATEDSSTKKRKRLTMDDVNISAPIYEPPKSFSVAGLYDPSFVIIEVLDESSPSWTQKFTLPLDLLTARSAYFRVLFEGGFAESQQGYVKLRDVSPWVFRVFVGWLYCQNIFYEVESKQPRQFIRQPQPAPMKIKAVKRKAKENLYVFSDMYDTRESRTSIFDVIQMKLFGLQSRRYLLPGDKVLGYSIDNLPPTSPLYRLLVDCWGKWLGLATYGPTVDDQATPCEGLPAHFLSRCLTVSKRSDKAMQCLKCRPGGTGAACDAADHTKEDRVMPPRKDVYTYHEHDDDDEKARCALRWELRRYLLQ